MELKNKVVMITGGSSGLGKAMAKILSDIGAAMVIISHDKNELRDAMRELNIRGFVVDVTKEKQVINIAKKVVREFGRIDVWINNAGTWLPHGPIDTLDFDRVHRAMEVNAFGLMYGSRCALLQMKSQGGGMIVNILSVSALSGRPYSAGYCATKYAAAGFTKSLRLEAEPDHIAVIGVYPGGMKTRLFDEARPDNYNEYMEPTVVAARIIQNMQTNQPELEQVIEC